MPKRIIGLAYAGMHRKAISERCGIGIGSVEQVISSQPGLVEHRKRCHWESKRRRCRLEIAKYLKSHPGALRRDCKAQCNAAFFGYISTILSGWIPLYRSRSNQLGDIQIVDSVNTKSLIPLVITSSGSNDISGLFRRFWDDISGRRSNKCTSTK